MNGSTIPPRPSTIHQLTARTMPFPDVADVLAAVGVLDDDRPETLAARLDEEVNRAQRAFCTPSMPNTRSRS